MWRGGDVEGQETEWIKFGEKVEEEVGRGREEGKGAGKPYVKDGIRLI